MHFGRIAKGALESLGNQISYMVVPLATDVDDVRPLGRQSQALCDGGRRLVSNRRRTVVIANCSIRNDIGVSRRVDVAARGGVLEEQGVVRRHEALAPAGDAGEQPVHALRGEQPRHEQALRRAEAVEDVAQGRYFLGLGTGVRFVTPFGPFRLDLGFNPDRHAGEDLFAIHVSLGYPF